MNDTNSISPRDIKHPITTTKKKKIKHQRSIFQSISSKYDSIFKSFLSKISFSDNFHNKLHILELYTDTDNITDNTEPSDSKTESKLEVPHFFTEIDAMFIFICLFLGILSRTFVADNPNNCTFDETHFGNFTNSYIRQEYFVDIHPPLAKLWISGFSKLQNYTGHTVYNSSTYTDTDYVELRFCVTSFSSLVPCLSYLSLRILGVSPSNSILSSVLLLCDNSLAAEGKLILTDGILHSVSLISVCCSCYLFVDDSIIHLIICGLSLGCACSIKYTAGGLISLPAFFLFFKICSGNLYELFILPPFQSHSKERNNIYSSEENESSNDNLIIRIFHTKFIILIMEDIIIVTFAISVLITTFFVHIIVLKYKSYLENGFDSSYENSLLWRWESQDQSRFVSTGLFKRSWISFVSMHTINNGCKVQGGFESKWYQWPLVRINSLIWFQTSNKAVWPLPNPFTYYFCVYGIILCFILPIFKIETISLISWTITYSSSLFPFILVPRTTYQYHYSIPLIIGVLGFCHSFSFLPMNQSLRASICYTICIITLVFGIYYFPILHSFPDVPLHFRAWKPILKKIYNQKFTMLSDLTINILQGPKA
ncbi:Dolichyl-phosphate-mannose-protein mannosyltransferase, putative [Trichomonas vaginalis G3]|uniref:Dolichyl-phosphate-mannose-protein mannosyltransferase, putative n=1 Tax=Trichomonas vaginalis (strain ATCC PRA-98 / G3) TaxID=412133 RepID=A2EGV0_TRIV3|nr:dolichyl-phosphate-mannose-protein mannosyltransferase protein [Trichomonas vaginalis G3]EAY08084.1 Dolichyl-phosphate-mannose-protein mannosyltransferase, putative [Trichomonas vaginalis G3]KAI5496703.1 dolichyl-phosphate-mannose-protein mannosyltransferase protein [Trichomonas vaginalis G3]|eukprot:XP_001320307.1 Dolichyl-phosphate-mannose-protein mannosyltransferase [Trichomonas vaginalis G3]